MTDTEATRLRGEAILENMIATFNTVLRGVLGVPPHTSEADLCAALSRLPPGVPGGRDDVLETARATTRWYFSQSA